jgi:hypothetical protein
MLQAYQCKGPGALSYIKKIHCFAFRKLPTCANGMVSMMRIWRMHVAIAKSGTHAKQFVCTLYTRPPRNPTAVLSEQYGRPAIQTLLGCTIHPHGGCVSLRKIHHVPCNNKESTINKCTWKSVFRAVPLQASWVTSSMSEYIKGLSHIISLINFALHTMV